MYTVYNLMYPRPRMISYIYFFLAVKLNLAEFRFSGGKLYLSTMISSLTVIGKVTIVIVKKMTGGTPEVRSNKSLTLDI